MRQVIINPFPRSPTTEDFSKIEQVLGGQIPQDYRNFVMCQNGGIAMDPEDRFWRFKYRDESITFLPNQRAKLDRLFSVGIGDRFNNYDDVLSAYDNIRRDDDTYPIDLLPIGETSASQIVCLTLGVNNGEVQLCSNGLAYCAGHIVLAQSFTEFINSLYLYNPDEDEELL